MLVNCLFDLRSRPILLDLNLRGFAVHDAKTDKPLGMRDSLVAQPIDVVMTDGYSYYNAIFAQCLSGFCSLLLHGGRTITKKNDLFPITLSLSLSNLIS